MNTKRKSFTNGFKAKVVLEVLENKDGIKEYINFLIEIPHSSLCYKTPMSVYMNNLQEVA